MLDCSFSCMLIESGRVRRNSSPDDIVVSVGSVTDFLAGQLLSPFIGSADLQIARGSLRATSLSTKVPGGRQWAISFRICDLHFDR